MKKEITFEHILSDDFAQHVVRELGLEDDTTEVQAHIISKLGLVIGQRVLIEVFKRIPEGVRDDVEHLIGEGDAHALHSLLSNHIPKLDALIHNEAQKELALLKAKSGHA